MTDLSNRLEELLSQFDVRNDPYNETTVHEALRELQKENLNTSEESNFLLQSEQMAFGFFGNDQNGESIWDTHFGPMMTWRDEDGRVYESPSIQLVTSEMINYWKHRAVYVNHPTLKLRYADLVWDFSQKVIGERPDVKFAHLVIDASLEQIKNKLYKYEFSAIQQLERSLSIALSINDKKRVEAVRDAILRFEDEIGDDSKPGLWGFYFDKLLLNKNVPLTEDQREKIVADLEARLIRLVNASGNHISPLGVENAAIRLANYYQSIQNPENMRRVLRQYGEVVISTARTSGAIAGLAHLQQLHRTYCNFGMREDADSLSAMISEVGQRIDEEMHEFSHTIEIPAEKIELYLEELTQGSLEEVLGRIAGYFIPNSEATAEQVRDLSAQAPLTFLLTRSILTSAGRPVAQVGSIEDDFEGQVVLQLAQNMQIESVLLRNVIIRMREKFNPSLETLLDILYLSPAFQHEYRNFVAQGLDAYLAGDHIGAAHILVPQIENALRQLLQILGSPLYKPNRLGGLSLRILDDILRDVKVENTLGNNVVKYLRVLLVDQRGWNVRNNLCHGMLLPDQLNIYVTDRLFHVLILLSLLREGAAENT